MEQYQQGWTKSQRQNHKVTGTQRHTTPQRTLNSKKWYFLSVLLHCFIRGPVHSSMALSPDSSDAAGDVPSRRKKREGLIKCGGLVNFSSISSILALAAEREPCEHTSNTHDHRLPVLVVPHCFVDGRGDGGDRLESLCGNEALVSKCARRLQGVHMAVCRGMH